MEGGCIFIIVFAVIIPMGLFSPKPIDELKDNQNLRESPKDSCFEFDIHHIGFGLNMPGSNNNYGATSSAEGCQSLCQKTTGCAWFNWNRAKGHCWLKTEKGNQIKKMVGDVTGPRTCQPDTSNGEDESNDSDGSDTTSISCLPGVRKFAASVSLSHFYDCPPGAETAKLMKCPHGTWNRKSMMCNNKPPRSSRKDTNRRESGRRNGESVNSEQNESPAGMASIPVLGRPVWLGDLYDAHREVPLNGNSLWEYDEINKAKLTLNNKYSITDFFVERSQNDRISKFNIDAELKLSFLGGLIEVGGSAKYLKDSRELSTNMRFNMMYEATTKTETLPMSLKKNTTHNKICEDLDKNPKSGPTHVVTTIEYGMKAVFIFEKSISIDESKEEVGGSLSVAIKSIPKLEIKGSAKVNLEGTQNKTLTNMKVKMYGDFIVSRPPTDYLSAIDTYREIINTLNPDSGDVETRKATAAPVKMTLTPIGEFCDNTDLVLASISAEITQKAVAILVELEDLVLEIKTLESTDLAKKFLDISRILKLFRLKLEIYELDVKSKLHELLPKMRGGEGEEELSDLLKKHLNSAFNYDSGILFLRERQRELNSMNIIFDDDMVRDGKIHVGDYSESNILRSFTQDAFVFIYYFNVFPGTWVTEIYLDNKTIHDQTWYNDPPRAGLASNHWREFKDFVNINKASTKFEKQQTFIIKASHQDNNSLTKISVYEKGKRKTADFKIPKPPPKPQVVSKTHNSVTLMLVEKSDSEENEFITEIVVKYGDHLDKEHDYNTATFKINKDDENITKTIKIPYWTKLENNTVPADYTFFTAFQASFCQGPYSKHLTNVRPLASSKPNLKPVEDINTNFAKLEWQEPDEMPDAKLLPLDGYTVNITGEDQFTKSVQTNDLQLTFPDLSHFTKYTGSVEIFFHERTIQGETAQFEFHTLPSKPDKPSVVNVTQYEITLQLTPRNKLGEKVNATFEKYQITYHKLDNKLELISDTKKEVDSLRDTIEISSLSAGSSYGFKYKVITSKASSEFSPLLHTTTKEYNSKLKELNEDMDKKEKEIGDKIKEAMPVGSIMAWVNKLDQFGDPLVDFPKGWQLCDGKVIPEGSIFEGLRTPDLNNKKLFLRGGEDDKVGMEEEDYIQDHEHNFDDNGHIHGYNEAYVNSTDACDSDRYSLEDAKNYGMGVKAEKPKVVHTIKTGKTTSGITMGRVKEDTMYRPGLETRPKNMNVIYIMRIF